MKNRVSERSVRATETNIESPMKTLGSDVTHRAASASLPPEKALHSTLLASRVRWEASRQLRHLDILEGAFESLPRSKSESMCAMRLSLPRSTYNAPAIATSTTALVARPGMTRKASSALRTWVAASPEPLGSIAVFRQQPTPLIRWFGQAQGLRGDVAVAFSRRVNLRPVNPPTRPGTRKGVDGPSHR